MKSDEIVIRLAEYQFLKDSKKFLECLRDAGVDNWSGFSFAQELFQQALKGVQE